MQTIPDPFRYHPAGALGSLLAGPPRPLVARRDALPEEPEPVRRRFRLPKLLRAPLRVRFS